MGGEKGSEGRKCQLVFIPLPGMVHLIPMVELAKRLLQVNADHHCRRLDITFLLIPSLTPNPNLASFLSSASNSHPSISFLHLPFLQPPPSPPNTPFVLVNSSYISLYSSSISSALHSSSSPISAILVDFLCCDLIQDEPNIPTYIFFTSSAAMSALLLLSPSITPKLPDDRKGVELTRDHVIPFPGFSSSGFPLPCLPDALSHGKNEVSHLFHHLGLVCRNASGILVNTFAELEPGVVRALEEGLYLKDQPTPKAYHVGPLLAPSFGEDLEEEVKKKKKKKKHECIQWLEKRPRGSVVFLCFGTMGSFPEEQVKEIAVGLERSGYSFLWVMRNEGLPEGFEERTEGRGLVWKSFAPQREVLGHEAVGGFVTHCGWNSCLESLWYGVPMAAWPRYAEQHGNAFEMVEEMEVAVEVKIDRLRGNAATASEVERAVKLLMGEESKKVREKVRKMKEKGRQALEKEGNGSSYQALKKILQVWTGDAHVHLHVQNGCRLINSAEGNILAIHPSTDGGA